MAMFAVAILMVIIGVYGVLWGSNHLDEDNATLCLFSSAMGCLIGVLLFFNAVFLMGHN